MIRSAKYPQSPSRIATETASVIKHSVDNEVAVSLHVSKADRVADINKSRIMTGNED
jgi:hypothetical protein